MRLTTIGLLVPAACLLAGGVTFVAGASVDGKSVDTIRACAKKKDGRLRRGGQCGEVPPRRAGVAVERPGTEGRFRRPGAGGSAGPAGPAGQAGAVGPMGPAGGGPAGAIGPAGPAGAQGAQGPAGPQGATGPKGDPGSGGVGSLEDLNGVACHAGGTSGTVAVTYDASGHAVITCTTGGGGGGGSGPIKVNEFSTGVTGAATNEFVELYNAGATPVDVSGYKVVYRSAAGTRTRRSRRCLTRRPSQPERSTSSAGAATRAPSRRTSRSERRWPEPAGASASSPRPARCSTRSPTARPRTGSARACPQRLRRPPPRRARATSGCPTARTRTPTPSTSPRPRIRLRRRQTPLAEPDSASRPVPAQRRRSRGT